MAEKEEAAAAAESALDVDRTAADGRGRGRTRTTPWHGCGWQGRNGIFESLNPFYGGNLVSLLPPLSVPPFGRRRRQAARKGCGSTIEAAAAN